MVNKRILLLGATGRTGRLVLEQALAEGYQVNCLVRSPEKIKIKSDSLDIFQGDTQNRDDLSKAIEACEAVISILNISRASDFPWAPLRTPKDFLSQTMSQLSTVAYEQGVNRIVVCSAWGVAETKADLPGWFRWFIDNSNIGVAYRDHERQEALLEASDLDWTIVRPVGLINSKKAKEVIESQNNQPKPKLLISRLNVAKYMINVLSKPKTSKMKVVISTL
ncbi:hypothetical protein BFP97_04080 [Roseivirga sp. 4D4]|uniref:NAD(P)-dependent oxidoreductase n=1 Tax=Roseivirga sp. 4D4 TaxID=1889784 RepID=UPI000853E819|nr:NAD(P)H-binding protein [Roseivirga sp. 4D4]OEK00737.1 hypothetical protein BFP97_04080 [Roseivirga sp. 4D4]